MKNYGLKLSMKRCLSELRLLGLLEISQLQASWAVHAKRVQGGCGTAWAAQNGQN